MSTAKAAVIRGTEPACIQPRSFGFDLRDLVGHDLGRAVDRVVEALAHVVHAGKVTRP